MEFNYFMPTRVIMGGDCVVKNRALLGELGKKALVVSGKNSARINGSYDDVAKALAANGQTHVLFDRVMSNPTVDCACDAAELIRREGCDFVIGIGGGSPMDAAKAAAALALAAVDRAAVHGASYTRALPLVEIPTTAGTGSEVTQYAILTSQSGDLKKSIGSPVLFPRYAFLDPRYMRRLGRETTVNTAIDALSHSIEGMLTPRSSEMSNALARESIAIIAGLFDELVHMKKDDAGRAAASAAALSPEVREKLLLASTLAGMVIAQTGTALVHAMGYELTLEWATDHGRANGLLLGAFLKFVDERERAAGIPPRIPAICAALGAAGNSMTLDEFSRLLDKLLGVREKASCEQIEAWAQKSAATKNAKDAYISVQKSDIIRLFEQSLG
ncbi:MAG: iron-containing alcohol dehydrogenase [Treponema sp.]|jgi:alcohol dehydrogenase class IV|nr:iron-containing alcohol dehydrogenase [Treponema sp.]